MACRRATSAVRQGGGSPLPRVRATGIRTTAMLGPIPSATSLMASTNVLSPRFDPSMTCVAPSSFAVCKRDSMRSTPMIVRQLDLWSADFPPERPRQRLRGCYVLPLLCAFCDCAGKDHDARKSSTDPCTLAPMTALRPTPPRPKIRTTSFAVAFAALTTVPLPVCMPHPRGANSCNSFLSFTRSLAFTTLHCFTIERFANEDWPKN